MEGGVGASSYWEALNWENLLRLREGERRGGGRMGPDREGDNKGEGPITTTDWCSWEPPTRKRVGSPPMARGLNVPLSPPREDSREPPKKRALSPPRSEWQRVHMSPPRKRDRSPPMGWWLKVPLTPHREDSLEPPQKRAPSPTRSEWHRMALNPPREDSWEPPQKRTPSPPRSEWHRVALNPPREDSLQPPQKRAPSPPRSEWHRVGLNLPREDSLQAPQKMGPSPPRGEWHRSALNSPREDSWEPPPKRALSPPRSPRREDSWELPRKSDRSLPMGGWLRVPMSTPREDFWEHPKKRVINPPMGGWLSAPMSPPKGRGWASSVGHRPPGALSSHATRLTPTSSSSGMAIPENVGTPWVSQDRWDGPETEFTGRSWGLPVPTWESCHDREIPPAASGRQTKWRGSGESRWPEEPSGSGGSNRGDPAWEARQRNLENLSYSTESQSGRGFQSQIDSREGSDRGPKGQQDTCVSLQTQRELVHTLDPVTALCKMAKAAMDREEGVDPQAVYELARSLSFKGSANQKPPLQFDSQIPQKKPVTPFTTRMTSLNSGGLTYKENKVEILKEVTRIFPNLPKEPPERKSVNRRDAVKPTLITFPLKSALVLQDGAAPLSKQDSDQQGRLEEEASLELWHRRFGHTDSATILRLQSDNLATGIKVDPVKADSTAKCLTCLAVKGDKSAFSINTVSRSTRFMDLVHCELYGPIDVPSIELQRYVFIFVDDYSRYCFIFVLNMMNGTHRCFKKFLAIFKKKEKPKAFQMNSAADSISPQTLALLERQGISHMKGVECIPGQSRTAEREMGCLLEMTHCMLADANLPKPFWAYAIFAATHLWNRLAVSCGKTTPFQARRGQVPCVNHVRVFGSLVCDRREPKDPTQHVLIGYNTNVLHYRVINLQSGRLYTKYSVLDFDERHGVLRNGSFLAAVEMIGSSIQPFTVFDPQGDAPRPGSLDLADGASVLSAVDVPAPLPPLHDAPAASLPETVPSVPGSCSPDRKARVLLVGNSFVYWAARRAASIPGGLALGLDAAADLEWRCRRGMTWADLLPCLFSSSTTVAPDVLLIHLGGNDLGRLKGVAISMAIQQDLLEVRQRWPSVRFVWSNIVPRWRWHAACDPRLINRARKGVNHMVARFLASGFGTVVCHPDIRVDHPGLYRPDGISLTALGHDMFLTGLRRGIKAELVSLVGVRC